MINCLFTHILTLSELVVLLRLLITTFLQHDFSLVNLDEQGASKKMNVPCHYQVALSLPDR